MNGIVMRFYIYFIVYTISMLMFGAGAMKRIKHPEPSKSPLADKEGYQVFEKLLVYGAAALTFFFFLIYAIDLPRVVTSNYKVIVGEVTRTYDTAVNINGRSFTIGEHNFEVGDKVKAYCLPMSGQAPRIEHISEQEYSTSAKYNPSVTAKLILFCGIAAIINAVIRYLLVMRAKKNYRNDDYNVSRVNSITLNIASVMLVILLSMMYIG